jgi:hypothetical protein
MSTLALTEIGTLRSLCQDKEDAHLLGHEILGQTPSLAHLYADKTTPQVNDGYGIAPCKLMCTGQAYGPTHYGMGHMTLAFSSQD